MQLLAKIATKFNLAAPNFKKFPGGGGFPPDPLETGMFRMPYSYYFQFKSGPLFLKKNHPT